MSVPASRTMEQAALIVDPLPRRRVERRKDAAFVKNKRPAECGPFAAERAVLRAANDRTVTVSEVLLAAFAFALAFALAAALAFAARAAIATAAPAPAAAAAAAATTLAATTTRCQHLFQGQNAHITPLCT